MAGDRKLRVTIWNEHVQERRDESVMRVYPKGMHEEIAAGLRRDLSGTVGIRYAPLEEPEHGLTDEVLSEKDRLTWWGHVPPGKGADEGVGARHAPAPEGKGLGVLHSAP